jgi:hypothetical protein
MTKASGNVRVLIKALGDIQTLVGKAMGVYMNDRSTDRADKLLPLLKQAFDICVEARGAYDPIDEE